ncbi:MAG: hypothetical protein ACRYFU_06495 [Janthinobacterium lividum]
MPVQLVESQVPEAHTHIVRQVGRQADRYRDAKHRVSQRERVQIAETQEGRTGNHAPD